MTPGLVRPPLRSRLSWVLRVLLTDSMVWAEWAEELLCGSGLFCFGGWSDEGDACLVEGLFEAFASVAFVGDDGLSRSGQGAVRQHGQAGVPFVCFGSGERPGDWQTRRCGYQVETQSPQVSGVGGAVPVFGPSCQVRALLGLAASSALYGGGVQHP